MELTDVSLASVLTTVVTAILTWLSVQANTFLKSMTKKKEAEAKREEREFLLEKSENVIYNAIKSSNIDTDKDITDEAMKEILMYIDIVEPELVNDLGGREAVEFMVKRKLKEF